MQQSPKGIPAFGMFSTLSRWKATPNPYKDSTLVGLHLGEERHASSGLSRLRVVAAPGLHMQRFWFPRKGVAVQLSTSFVACVATFTDATWIEILLVQEHCNEWQTKNSNTFRRGPSSTFYTWNAPSVSLGLWACLLRELGVRWRIGSLSQDSHVTSRTREGSTNPTKLQLVWSAKNAHI